MVISIVNEKGGSGKTTLAVNLAARLAEDDDNVLLIDADPQKSTEVFSDMRSQSGLKPLFSNVSKTGISLGDEIESMRSKFDSIIVDTGGRDSKEMRKAMLKSNIIIIPTIPSQYDVPVLEHMLEIYDDSRQINSNLLAFVLINRSSPNPFLAKDLENLREFINTTKAEKGLENVILLENALYERQAYRKAVIDGKSIREFCTPNEKALSDFEAFYKEFLELAKERI
ncbi:chromosome partitioning protein ParA [Campylobacter sp. MIT 12-8780]|uniref:AAA family ATPase n=1 Tax=unclassified Campylobacter TaxID=2593542 RepID=UPI0010F78E03|nr:MULTISPECIES: AAA family ATPase [unclassified Campylobacter]NDJ28043.1 AAA family ATPase [Campylobacter sp. MIT 19-121]TKX28270.1 chromosome partitioning protein ParA [Campylobacter sp. MIT 12-5580]TQR39987.1 chromosome partitioning protein ParA [Campylobacter sp. MIT 12-8780]